MPSTPPDASGLEALVGRLDVQPWLSRRRATPNEGLGLGTPFLRALGLPAALHLPAILVVALAGSLVGGSGARAVVDGVASVVFPVLEALACVVLAVAFQRRRAGRTLTHGLRAQSRLLGLLLTGLSVLGTGVGFWEPVAVSGVALLTLLAPASVPARADGRPWWWGE